ncbi:MAG: thioredoxin family protein [Alphaproteobacteria bacterium]|nr:thioredoxin family protein [Alphaproteobacteria bacterium]
MFKRTAVFICIFFLMSAAAHCEVIRKTPRAEAVLDITEQSETLTAELSVRPQGGWHIHSFNPGEFGMPIEAKWNLGNYRLRDFLWSEGEDILYQGFGINVYKTSGIYQAVLEKGDGELPSLELSFLSCKDECIPEHLSFTITPQDIKNKPRPQQLQSMSLLTALLLAFAGGIILNLMPCVFPVLFIKIVAITQAKDRRRNFIDAVSYFAGVVLCFLITAGILKWLKSQGEAIGWGFQLQSPLFVGFMALLFLILAGMFLDIIKINQSLKKIPSGAFLTGLLAVLIASPCTAPFMGAAIGFVITSNVPAEEFYGVFAALGTGYALPFTLAGMFPQFMEKITPRPGKWMVWLKKAFAIPMLATAGWLIWIVIGEENISSAWQDFDAAQVEELTKNGEKVFIDFSAKWCLTCLANEKNVLDDKRFINLAQEKNIRIFRADWTNRNTEITEALAQFGRSSVPLYVYFNEKGKSVILPQILNFDILLEYLK